MEELKTSLTINLSKIPEIINFESGQMSPKGHFTINTPNTPKKDNKKRKNMEEIKDIKKKLKF